MTNGLYVPPDHALECLGERTASGCLELLQDPGYHCVVNTQFNMPYSLKFGNGCITHNLLNMKVILRIWSTISSAFGRQSWDAMLGANRAVWPSHISDL